jgi:hypothetical protein
VSGARYRPSEPSPEIVAAVVAVLSAMSGEEDVPELRSRWLARTRPEAPRWQSGAGQWQRRARLNAVERERHGGY